MATSDAGLFLTKRRVPVILQQERAECGLVCLAMIAAYFGKQTNLATLRERSRLSGHGTTFHGLLRIAQYLRLIARPVRLSLGEVSHLQLPAVLHWRMNHFVVLTHTGRRRVTIHDPATGRRDVAHAELDESFTGVALEFTAAPDFVPGRERQTPGIAVIVGSFGKLYRYLGLMLCLLIASQVLALVPSIATQVLVDEVVLGQDRDWLYRALGGLAIVMLAGIVLDGLRGWIGLYAGTRLAADSTVRVLSHLLNLPVSFIHRRHLGDLMSKLESLTPIRQALTEHGLNAVVQLVVLISTLSVMFLYSPWLTAVSVAGLTLTVALILSILPRSRQLGEQLLIHRATQNSSLVETLKGYDTVQSLGLGGVRRLHWQNCFLSATSTQVAQGKLSIFRTAATGLISASEQVFFLAVGITGILEKDITLGVLFAFFGLRGRFGNAALTLTDLLQRFSLLKVHTDRLSDIVFANPIPDSCKGAVNAKVTGDLQAREVSFSYGDHSPVITNFCCEIEAGSSVVITGLSGCGKTTLLGILAGHLDTRSGYVLIDGLERSLWDRQSLTEQCAMVMQHDKLFQGTIAENISAFSATPDLARVRDAALQSHIWPDIQALPMRTETLIGDTGAGLSGGQIQRLTLARALYRQPRILFLDEATSQLDVRTEKRVLRNIAGLGMTVISVAHRPEAIALAGRVITLNAAGH